MRKEKCGLPKLLELGSLFHTEFLWLVQTDENTCGQKKTKPQPYYSQYFFSDSRPSCIKCLVFLNGALSFSSSLWVMLFPPMYSRSHLQAVGFARAGISNSYDSSFVNPWALALSFWLTCWSCFQHDWNSVMEDWLRQMQRLADVYLKFHWDGYGLQGNPFASTTQQFLQQPWQLPHHNNRRLRWGRDCVIQPSSSSWYCIWIHETSIT